MRRETQSVNCEAGVPVAANPGTKGVHDLFAEILKFVPIRLRVVLYDATEDTNKVVVVTEKALVDDIWNFVKVNARNPPAPVPVPAAGAVLFDFYDADGNRHRVDYDSHPTFTIDGRISGELTGSQAEKLFFLERSLSKKP